MAGFAMCPEAREYADPDDRRYHAQAIACPRCGPTLTLLDPQRTPLPGHPLDAAAALLARGDILAILFGLGGFHLACDATSPAAVALSARASAATPQPFAVMVATRTRRSGSPC